MTTTTDPVCGMTVDPEGAGQLVHRGTTYFFCSNGCKEKFAEDPERYVGDREVPALQGAKSGIYTCPMHPEVRQQGPGVYWSRESRVPFPSPEVLKRQGDTMSSPSTFDGVPRRTHAAVVDQRLSGPVAQGTAVPFRFTHQRRYHGLLYVALFGCLSFFFLSFMSFLCVFCFLAFCLSFFPPLSPITKSPFPTPCRSSRHHFGCRYWKHCTP